MRVRTSLVLCITVVHCCAGRSEKNSAGDVVSPSEVAVVDGAGALDGDGVALPDSLVDVGPQWESMPIEPTAAFLDRKAAYFAQCSDGGGAGLGGFYAQVCRVAAGASEYNVGEIDKALEKVNGRLDTADFRVAGLVRLLNLVDFAEDEVIRTKAAMVLDIVLLDLLNNMYKGNFATTHGRTYSSKFLDGLQDSTGEMAWISLGLGAMGSPDNFSGAFMATSTYVPPALLEELAGATADHHEHRQRDSISIEDAAAWGLTYTGMEDVVFWAGLSALVAPEVVNGTVGMLDDYGLWTGFLFGDIPEPFDSMLKQMAGTPELEQLATEMEVVSRGIALESVSTYTYRTPHYQLSGAQDTKAGFWTAQTQMWQATLDGQAYVLTSFPGKMDDLEAGLEFGDAWIGGWLPRVTMHRNVGVIQYRKDSVPLLDDYLTADYLHAFFPKAGFDEVREVGNWVFGRKGEAYLALGSQHPVYFVEENDYELRSDFTENVWVVELGSVDEWTDFDAFVAAVSGAALTFDLEVAYDSPSVGMVGVAWAGPFTVDGEEVDLGPFKRWDNAHCVQEFGSFEMVVFGGTNRLRLDFSAGERALERAFVSR